MEFLNGWGSTASSCRFAAMGSGILRFALSLNWIKMIKPEIIGSGLIAKSFDHSRFSQNVLILAAGVSNSRENRSTEFLRERELILRMMERFCDHHVVYFSSCSVLSETRTAYIDHKIAMEAVISTESRTFNIFRLPQLVGCVQNQTIISYFANAILDEVLFPLQNLATRHLLDVADMVRVVIKLVRDGHLLNSVQDVSPSHEVLVTDIVYEMSRLLCRPAKIRLEETGTRSKVDISSLRMILGAHDPIFESFYWRNVLERYMPYYLSSRLGSSSDKEYSYQCF